MMDEAGVKKVMDALCPEGGPGAFAVLDGASIPRLLEALYGQPPEYFCLLPGELTADLAAVAPYLVELPPDAPFTRWVISEGWGNHWGIFAQSAENSRIVRNHFGSLLTVQSSQGKPMMFRFYDPRVLRVYLPTCNPEETRAVFGPVTAFLLEAQEEHLLLRLTPGPDGPLREEIPLKAAQA